MRPTVMIMDAVTEGVALGGEPEAYVIFVMKDGARLARFYVSNPDYVAPPPPTPLERAEERVAEAQNAAIEAIKELGRVIEERLELELDQ